RSPRGSLRGRGRADLPSGSPPAARAAYRKTVVLSVQADDRHALQRVLPRVEREVVRPLAHELGVLDPPGRRVPLLVVRDLEGLGLLVAGGGLVGERQLRGLVLLVPSAHHAD